MKGRCCLAALAFCAPALAADFDRLASLFESERQRHGIPSMGVAVVAGDEVLWATAFGYEDRDGKRPASAATRYRIGSVGKAFNALAILRSGCASDTCLDRPLREFNERHRFAGPGSNPVTVRALLSHSAGIIREPPIGHYLQADHPGLAATIDSLIGTCRVFEPDTNRIKYSNAGVTLAGGVLERLAGTDYPTAIRRLVFQPAGMPRADVGVPPDTAYAVFRTRKGDDVPAPRFDIGMTPAGDMVASPSDLAAFMMAVFSALDDDPDRVFEAVVIERMIQPFGDLDRPDWHMEVGLGLVLNGKFEGTRMARHGGGVYGFSTEFALLPEERFGVAVSSARAGTLTVAQNLAHHILRLLLAERRDQAAPEYSPVGEPGRRTRERLNELRQVPFTDIPEQWRPLIGFYGWQHGGVEILSDGEALFASVEGGSPDRLQATGDDHFRFGKFDDYAYEFLAFVQDGERVAGLAVGAGLGPVLPREGIHGPLPPTHPLPCPNDGR